MSLNGSDIPPRPNGEPYLFEGRSQVNVPTKPVDPSAALKVEFTGESVVLGDGEHGMQTLALLDEEARDETLRRIADALKNLPQ